MRNPPTKANPSWVFNKVIEREKKKRAPEKKQFRSITRVIRLEERKLFCKKEGLVSSVL